MWRPALYVIVQKKVMILICGNVIFSISRTLVLVSAQHAYVITLAALNSQSVLMLICFWFHTSLVRYPLAHRLVLAEGELYDG